MKALKMFFRGRQVKCSRLEETLNLVMNMETILVEEVADFTTNTKDIIIDTLMAQNRKSQLLKKFRQESKIC